MKIAISSGHGKYIRGARGNPVPPQLDEVDEARRVVNKVADYLRSAGIGVTTFHDDVSTSQSANLDRIVDWHNSQTRDLDVSVHFNAYDHSAHGCEVLYVTQSSLADRVCDAIVAAGGFTNRGPKKRTDLAFLNGTDEPAILIETCFCDNTGDSNLFNSRFEAICHAIAESASGQSIGTTPPPETETPPTEPPPSGEIPVEDRPTLRRGDFGPDVVDLQNMLPDFSGEVDGDFGSITENEVIDYQMSRALDADGIVGQQTWTALYNDAPAVQPPEGAPPPISMEHRERIAEIANTSAIASYSWRDRGRAPKGYVQGIALSFAQTYLKLMFDHPAAIKMAKANTHNDDKDALAWFNSDFAALGMSNEAAGPDTLRHLYVMLMGLGMRESSGKHCEGRDMSADNVTSDTAESGLYQSSYNAHSASDPEFSDLMEQYAHPANERLCFAQAFAEGVSCSSSDWQSYGSGAGKQFQDLCKSCPAFAVETCALTLRHLRQHYGPVNRKELELKTDADVMFKSVQDYVDTIALGTGV